MEIVLPYRQFRPSALLAGFVECYWAWRSAGDSGRAERLIPGGRVELVFNFGKEMQWLMADPLSAGVALHGAHVIGQRDRIFYCRAHGVVELFGVRFKPGGFAAFSPTPVNLLLDQLLPAAELFGPRAGEWRMRLYEAGSDDRRVSVIEELLCTALRLVGPKPGPLQEALRLIRQSEGLSVEAIGEKIGWGYKRMERAFLKEVGYTPKGYSRLIRFNKAIRRMEKVPSLTELGYLYGYYDQAHFIKDFSRYTGTTPGRFRLGENRVAEYLLRNQPV
jgi:AraC-like DNA-binding protein